MIKITLRGVSTNFLTGLKGKAELPLRTKIQCFISSPVSVPSSCVRQHNQDVPAQQLVSSSTYSIFVVFNNNSRKEEWRAIIMALFFGCKWHYCRVFLFRHEPPLVAYMETWQLICQLCHVDKECRRHFYCTFVQFHPKKEVSWHLSTSTGKWPFFSRWN